MNWVSRRKSENIALKYENYIQKIARLYDCKKQTLPLDWWKYPFEIGWRINFSETQNYLQKGFTDTGTFVLQWESAPEGDNLKIDKTIGKHLKS